MNTLPVDRLLRFALLTSLSLLALTVRATTYSVATATDFHNALNQVLPGDTVVVSGSLTGNFKILRSGTAAAPITIRGDGTAQLNCSSGYGFEIRSANHVNLENMIIRGGLKGLVIDNSNHGVVHQVHIMDTQQEAFKVRNQSQYWEFTYCSVRRAGTSGDYGEGFYVGQASSNWIGGVPDRSGYITFFNCYTTDTSNDGWDFKEGSHDIKVVNCTADFSGTIEPVENAARGSAGFYLRADRIQVIKCSVLNLNNNDWSFRISNQDVQGVDYGSSGNEIKQSASLGGNVGMVYLETGTNGVVYTDYTVTSSTGLYATSSAPAILRDPSLFVERTWSGEGGGVWGDLNGAVGCTDPMSAPSNQVAAPAFNPAGGTYTSAQNVTISSATSGASIRYTVDGSTPTSTTGTLYTGPVAIAATTTLKAIAYASGMTNSAVTTATYTISTGGAPAAPTALTANGGKGKITLSWVQSTSAVTRNRVYRATTSGGPYTLRGDFGARTNYTDTAAAGTTYYYVVTAVTAAGAESGYSNQASAAAR